MTILLPGYRIIREIGTGGFGKVFEAVQERTGQVVAVKFLHLSTIEAIRRFKREVKALWKNLRNPFVVKLIDHDLDGPWPYLVTEFCPGGSLRNWVNSRRSWQEIVTALIHTARGLTAWHQAGGFHRDIKPDNLLVDHDSDGNLVVKVADFGLARSPEIVSDCITQGPCGTQGYLPPEVLGGKDFTPAADVFALGITGIELLTGHRDPATLDRVRIPAALRELLRRMTAHQPSARPNIAEVEAKLLDLLTTAAAAPQKQASSTWLPWIIGGAAGAVAIAAAGIAIWVNQGSSQLSSTSQI